MAQRRSPTEWECIRIEYITDPSRPSAKTLAEKWQMPQSTLERRLVKEKWHAQREEHWKREIASLNAQKTGALYEGYSEAVGDAMQKLDGWMHHIMGAIDPVVKLIVPQPGMTEEEKKDALKRAKEIPPDKLYNILDRLTRCGVEVMKARELLAGRPTGRTETIRTENLRPVELDRAEAEAWEQLMSRARVEDGESPQS